MPFAHLFSFFFTSYFCASLAVAGILPQSTSLLNGVASIIKSHVKFLRILAIFLVYFSCRIQNLNWLSVKI